MYRAGILILLFLLVACGKKGEKIPAEVVPPDSMAAILADMYIADAALSNMQVPYDSLTKSRKTYMDAVFSKFSVSRDRFDSSYQFYTRRIELLESIQDEVIVLLVKKEAEVE